MDNKILVTKPFLPSLDELIPLLEDIWQRGWVTNNGHYHQELELALARHLGVPYVSLFSNATIALIVAIKSLDLVGDVITTPFSFVATAHSLMWNGLNPVFVDIEPDTCNIDATLIERAITPATTAIMPVHVYGNPCDVQYIDRIAQKYNLKVIYDAAHAFGVKYMGETILNWGNLSVLSFHATKVFNTFEGGAIISHNPNTKKRIDLLKNFGFIDEVQIGAVGINGKMNEFQAALGLLQLNHIKEVISRRKDIATRYSDSLKDIKGIRIIKPKSTTEYNYAYYPILIDSDMFGLSRDEVYERLKLNNIYTRRYFYPLITQFPPYSYEHKSGSNNLVTAELIAKRVLCLPLYPELLDDEIEYILSSIKSLAKSI